MIKKIWDIQQPKDYWGIGYARLAYSLECLRSMSAKKIEISYE